MANLATAYVQIVPTMKGTKANLEKELGGIANDTGEKSGKGFGSTFLSGASATIKGGVALIGSAITAIGGTATAVWGMTNNLASSADEIDKTSQKLGVTAEQYQALAYSAERSGFEVSAFTTASRQLADSGFDGTLYDALNAVMAIEDPLQRSAKAQELFGERSAQAMSALLNGEDDIDDYMSMLDDLGGLMSDEMVKNGADFEDALTDIKKAFGGLQGELLGGFMPSMTTVMNGLAMLVGGNDEGLGLIKQGITDFLNNLQGMLPQLLSIASELINSFTSVIVDNLPQIVQMGIEFILKLAVGIVEALPQLISKAPEIVMALVNGIKAVLPQLKDAGLNMVKGIWNGIQDAKEWLKDKIRGWANGVVDNIKEFFGIHSPSRVMADEVGKYLSLGVADGIAKNSFAVDDAMGNLVDTARLTASANINATSQISANGTSVDAIVQLLATYLPMIEEKSGVTLSTDAKQIFNIVRDENRRFAKATGYNALAMR